MTTSLLDDSWKNSVGQQDLLYTCIGRLHCNDIVRHARCAEIFITPKDEVSSVQALCHDDPTRLERLQSQQQQLEAL